MPAFFEIYQDIFKLSDPSQPVGRIGIGKQNIQRIDKSVYKSQFKSFDKDKPFNNPICKDILPIFDSFYFQLNKVQRIYGSGGTGKTCLLLKQYTNFTIPFI